MVSNYTKSLIKKIDKYLVLNQHVVQLSGIAHNNLGLVESSSPQSVIIKKKMLEFYSESYQRDI
jgi:hypothetical protein